MTNLKKAISILLSISIMMSLFAFSGINAFADENDFKYSVVNGSAVITGYSGNAKSLDVPEKIGGYTVTGVDANAFFYAKELESISFPSTVTNISPSVFQGYVNIKEIAVDSENKNYSSENGVLFDKNQSTLLIYPKGNERTSYEIPNTVSLISSHAFYAAENLSEIIIPDSVQTIEFYAFESCTALTEIVIPSGISSIGDLAFYRCLSLKSITVDETNKTYASENGVLFNKAKTDLILYPSAFENTEYAVPASVKNIGAYAFESASNLADVTLPDTLVTIGSNAFKNCVSLTDISIPDSVKTIDSGAFHGCTALVSVKLPSAISVINDDTFFNCINLTDVTIPLTVISIGSHAFENCHSLKNIFISENVKKIGDSAFAGCSKNTDVKYAGSKTDFAKIKIGTGNDILKSDVRFGKLHFVDLAGFEVYNDYVMYTSVYNNFITGTNPPERTRFSPKDSVTRAMFVTILYRMAGEPYNNGRNPHRGTPFADIKDTGVYYYDAACWALDNGITNQKYFKPNEYVSREQTAAFLFRYADKNNLIEDDSYKSASLAGYRDYKSVNGWAVEAMQWANYSGMITGTLQNTLNPQGATQRIHASKILYGFGKVCGIGNFE